MAKEDFDLAKEEIEEINLDVPIIAKDNPLNAALDTLIAALSLVLAVFQVYTGLRGQAEFYIQRGLHMFLVLLLSSLFMYRVSKNITSRILHAITFLGVLFPFTFFFLNFEHFRLRLWGFGFTTMDLITGIILVVSIFIMAQKTVGWVMPIIGGLSIAYLFLGRYAPGIFSHSGYGYKFVVELSSWSEMGIFSTPIGVAASYLYLFILFGTMIEQMGTGHTLIELAKSIAGRQKGGPAKIAVVSSAMMGSISGSPIANVLTTGAFTIPMMKKLGFEPAYAAGVEAVASTGGMILPPVMGVLAFAMVDYSGISYSRIILCAAIPAVMYYLCAFFAVHFHAVKLDMKPLSADEMQPVGRVLRDGWLTLVPVLILAVPLCMGYTPLITVSWATISLIPISFFGRRNRWMTPRVLLKCFIKAAKNMRTITLPCALAGIIAGALSMTGVGVRLTSILLKAANGNLTVLLLLVAGITIVMGCGLPSLLAYMIQLPITIPAMIQMGVSAAGAHLFVVYYATLAFITPPVGMSLFAAAGLAGSSFMKTGWHSVKIGAAGFLVPFMFIFCPSLLLIEFSAGVLTDVAFAVLSTYILAAGIEGFLFSRLNFILRIIAICAAVALMLPDRRIGVAALAVTAVIVIVSKRASQKAQSALI